MCSAYTREPDGPWVIGHGPETLYRGTAGMAAAWSLAEHTQKVEGLLFGWGCNGVLVVAFVN